MRRRPARSRGQTMVEFAIVAPLLFLLVFGIIDFGRYTQAAGTIAEAARQGAREAIPNALSSDNPFTGTPNGTCPGTVFTSGQTSTQGCLTDAAVKTAVASAMNGLLAPSDVTVHSDTDAATCTALGTPAVGKANLCISPADTGSTTHTSQCPTGYPAPTPTPAAVTRQSEWQNQTLKGCFYVTVTVVYGYRPWTPLLSAFIGTRSIVSTSSIVAEY